MQKNNKRFLILALLIIIVVLFFSLGGYRYFSLAFLQNSRAQLLDFYAMQPALLIGAYVVGYILVVALSLPFASVVTLFGGVIFGWPLATALAIISATIGSIIPYLLAGYLFRDFAERRFKKAFSTVNKGMADSGWWYLLSARLSPIIPFYLLNIAAGITRLPLKQYISATFIGIIPGTAVIAFTGSQLGAAAETGQILRPGIVVAFILLATLPLLIRFGQKKLLPKVRPVK